MHIIGHKILNFLMILSFLMFCSCERNDLYSGPSVNIGPVEASITMNSKREILVDGEITLPIISNGYVGINWKTGISQTLVDAEKNSNYLYVLWEDDSNIYQNVYDIGKPFEFHYDCVNCGIDIKKAMNGNIIVEISEKQKQITESAYACNPQFSARLNIGDQAKVIVYQVSVRENPGLTASLVEGKYYRQGRIVSINDGPECRDGINWWYVSCDEVGYSGWVAEADNENYYLEPIDY